MEHSDNMQAMIFDDGFAHWVIGQMPLHALDLLYRQYITTNSLPVVQQPPRLVDLTQLREEAFVFELIAFRNYLDEPKNMVD